MILGIDPGTTESGFVMMENGAITDCGVVSNDWLLSKIAVWDKLTEPHKIMGDPRERVLVIEMIASYGMAVGKEVFETCVWIGRFMQASVTARVIRVPRLDVKLHLCHDSRAKDANIRRALIDRLGPPGTKKAPGPTYGIKSHAWAALAVAVTAQDQLEVLK